MHTICEDAEPVISSNDKIRFPFKDPPENKEIKRINDNIFWARMKIPYPLNHVNVYILKDGESLTIVDTGMNTEENKEEEEKNLDTTLLLEPNNEEAIYMLINIQLDRSNFEKANTLMNRFTSACKKMCDKKTEISKSLQDFEANNEKTN